MRAPGILRIASGFRVAPLLGLALASVIAAPSARGADEAAALAKAAALVDDGIVRANQGDNEAAEKLFRQAVKDAPKYEPAHLNLGLILARGKRLTEAEAEVDRAMKLAPEDPAALAAAGRVKASLRKGAEGVALLRRAVALAPQSADIRLELGMALAESYDLAGALTEMDEALRMAPGSALAHLSRGRVLLDLGRNGEAQPELESARRIDPAMAEPYYFLAVIEKQAGHTRQAVSLLQTVVKLQSRNATAWRLLGQSLEYESQTQAAIAAWKQALAIDPKDSQVLWSLARALKPSDPTEAARLMARYSEVLKERHIVDQAGTLGNDALAAAAAHDWPEAIHKFHEAIEVCGNCSIRADLHEKLGLIEFRMGDIDGGERELRLARTLKPDDPDIKRALERIAAIRAKKTASGADAGRAP